jgi:hypothetical protein
MAGWMAFILLLLLIEALFEPIQSLLCTIANILGGDQ